MATPEALNTTGFDNRLGLRALTNTSSFDSATPNPILSSRSVDAETYGIPPLSDQKPGDFPLGQCLNADPCATRILGAPGPVKPEVEGQLDSNDTRMQQVVYVNGLVWSSLDTIVSVDGATRAGVAYFAVQPSVERAARWAAVGGGGAGLRRGGEQQRGVPGALPAAQWSRRDCDDAGRTGLLSQRGIRAYQQHCRGGCGQYRMVLASARRMGSRSTLYSMVQARIHPPRARAGVTTGRPSQTVTTSGWPPSSSGRHARSRSIRHPLLGAVAEHAPPWPIGAPISAA